mmetsp:Transcript_69988/g.217307  ORF Transcript_69988/g.217307 Transcript_69988/m.217307 type:complete len:250 (+) Transcript_69988:190-939(+)
MLPRDAPWKGSAFSAAGRFSRWPRSSGTATWPPVKGEGGTAGGRKTSCPMAGASLEFERAESGGTGCSSPICRGGGGGGSTPKDGGAWPSADSRLPSASAGRDPTEAERAGSCGIRTGGAACAASICWRCFRAVTFRETCKRCASKSSCCKTWRRPAAPVIFCKVDLCSSLAFICAWLSSWLRRPGLAELLLPAVPGCRPGPSRVKTSAPSAVRQGSGLGPKPGVSGVPGWFSTSSRLVSRPLSSSKMY